MEKSAKKIREGTQGILFLVKKTLNAICSENGGDASLVDAAARIITIWYINEGMSENELRADDFYLEGDIEELLDAASDPEESRTVKAAMGIQEEFEESTMRLETVLDEGRKINFSSVNIKGSLEGKRMREAFEEGQPELDMDFTAAGSIQPDISQYIEKARSYGETVGAQYSGKLMAMARSAIRGHKSKTGVDMAANAKAVDMDQLDLEMEDDSFFDIMGELNNAFLEGMENDWPFPIVS